MLKPQYTSKAVWERISCYLIACVDSSQRLSKLRPPDTVTDSLTVYEYIHIKQKQKEQNFPQIISYGSEVAFLPDIFTLFLSVHADYRHGPKPVKTFSVNQ